MNEGWASYWHSTIMTQKAMTDADVVDFADRHAATMMMAPGTINPYKLGLELYRDIEERWNKGRHGREWDECNDMQRKATWDTGEMRGREKIFEVRKLYDDIGFVSEFLTPEFCQKHKLFAFDYNRGTGSFEIASREFEAIKEKLLFSLTNSGQPFISVDDGNYKNRSELLLVHDYFGTDLDTQYVRETMLNFQLIWGRPVNLLSKVSDQEILYTHDGKDFTEGRP